MATGSKRIIKKELEIVYLRRWPKDAQVFLSIQHDTSSRGITCRQHRHGGGGRLWKVSSGEHELNPRVEGVEGLTWLKASFCQQEKWESKRSQFYLQHQEISIYCPYRFEVRNAKLLLDCRNSCKNSLFLI